MWCCWFSMCIKWTQNTRYGLYTYICIMLYYEFGTGLGVWAPQWINTLPTSSSPGRYRISLPRKSCIFLVLSPFLIGATLHSTHFSSYHLYIFSLHSLRLFPQPTPFHCLYSVLRTTLHYKHIQTPFSSFSILKFIASALHTHCHCLSLHSFCFLLSFQAFTR